jgi:hypothetical protein
MIARLGEQVRVKIGSEPTLRIDIRRLTFEEAFAEHQSVLVDKTAAKLLLIDQFGVKHVTDDVFSQLVRSPRTDFLFFISSSTLYRFAEHPAIKQKIKRLDDYYHVHHAVLSYYRSLLPPGKPYHLAPFSIKKGANIYGIIFGSRHPLGMDKFLEAVWKTDAISGAANFDINRENFRPGQKSLFPPTKVAAFEIDLEQRLRSRAVANELDIIAICFAHGVRRKHAAPVLERLKRDGTILADFRVPQLARKGGARAVQVLG